MSFILSKVLWTLAAPGHALLLASIAGWLLVGLGRGRWRRLGHGLLGIGVLGFLAIFLLPVEDWLIRPLENRFPVPAPPAQVDGIIVLGGAVRPQHSADRGQPSLNAGAERLIEMAALVRRYPEARLVFTGGAGDPLRQEWKESDVARAVLDRLGLDTGRIVFESASRNTYENVLYSRRLVNPQPGEVWLLVTSAWHMPRAVGIFRRQGWPVLAWPVDYYSLSTPDPRPLIDFAGDQGQTEIAVREWIGLVAYYLMDRTDALFPAP